MKKFPRKLQRMVALIVLCAVASTAVTGCGTRTGSTDKQVEINVGWWPTEAETEKTELYKHYVELMNEKYPNIKIIPNEYSYSVDTFMPLAASGQLPNIVNLPLTEPQNMIEAGFARDVTDAIEEYGYLDKTNPVVLDAIEKDGRYYGIPLNAYNLGLCLNVKLFKEAGLVDENGVPMAPKTYEELAETAAKITEKTGKAGFFFPTLDSGGGFYFMNIAWSYGVKFMEKVDGKYIATFNSPECVAAMEYLRDLKYKYNTLQENLLVKMSDFQKYVATDQAAMGFFTYEQLERPILNYNADKDNLAMFSIPGGPAGRYAQMGGTVYMVSQETTDEQLDAIMKWIDIKGEGPRLDESNIKNLEEKLASDAEANLIVGKPSFNLWTDPERHEKEKQIYDKYRNVNLDYFPETEEDVELHVEEPVGAQQLYILLSKVIQTVLMDENTDIQAKLNEAASEFQKDVLDDYNSQLQ